MNLEKLKKYNIFEDELLSLEKLLNQGFNNTSYLLKTSKNSYIIRVFKSNDSVNISRNFEYTIQKRAFKQNIASKPIFLNNEFMIYEYAQGIHKTKLSKIDIKNLILKIKKYHNFKIKEKTYDLYKDFKNYEKILKDIKSKKLLAESFKILRKLKKYKTKIVLSHHDLNPKNIIFNKYNIKIIDWEYSGANDRFFDLASICIEFSLNKEEEKLLLKNYFKNDFSINLKILNHFKIIYKNLCYLWFLKLNNL